MLKTPRPGFPPFLQDGTAATFPETIRLIARYQHGRNPDSESDSSIVQFLDSLSSEAGERVDLAHTR